jgi:hypothetical protein
VVGLFEAFFTDSAEQVLSKSQLKKFKDASFMKQLSCLESNLGIKINGASVNIRIKDIDEVFARRNLLLHRGGKVDKYYLDRVGYSPSKEGDDISVDEHYFLRAAYSFRELGGYLYGVLKENIDAKH